MTASSTATSSSVGHQATLNHVPPTTPVCVIDFFEAGQRLLTEGERTVRQSEIERQIKRPVVLRDRFAGLADVFEQAFYWLIWASVLACLAFGIFGL